MERTETLRPAAKIRDQLPSEKDGENTKTPNPLAGAEFTIYQVHDADWLSKYYSGAAATEQEETEYKNAFDATKYYTDNNNGTYTVKLYCICD